MMRRLTEQGIYRITLFIAIIILLLMSYFSVQKTKNLIEYSSRIQQFQEVQKTLEKTFSILKDAESSQRGFIISNDSNYYRLFVKSINSINTQKGILDTLLTERSIQKLRLDTLSRLIDERTTLLTRVLKVKRDHSTQEFESINKLFQPGYQKMDQIRQLIDRMQSREEEKLIETKIEKEKLSNITPFFLLLLSTISLILLFVSYFAMSRELRKRIEFEKELANSIEELNRSNSDLEHFAYVASHDLQEPLRKIRSFGDRLVLKHASALEEDGRTMIAKIQNAAGRMQTLIDDLLSFSRLLNATGKTEKTDLNELLKDVLADLEVTIQSKKAKIISEPLPTINAVPSLIRQLFQNLLANALKFSQPGTPPLIEIGSKQVKGKTISGIDLSRQNENFSRIEFKDNGIGFDEKYLDRIFVIFQRLHGKLEYEGTGIGLAVCKRIMNIHHGYITAQSKPNEGSSFILFFPATDKIK